MFSLYFFVENVQLFVHFYIKIALDGLAYFWYNKNANVIFLAQINLGGYL